MTEEQNPESTSIFAALLEKFKRAASIEQAAFSSATGDKGVNVPAYENDLFSKLASLFSFGPAANEFIGERNAGAKEAAARLGYSDGIVPLDKLSEFKNEEKNIRHQVLGLRRELQERSIQLFEAGADKTSFQYLFAKDSKTHDILENAEKQGMSPLLINSVKNSLVEQDRRMLGDEIVKREIER